MKIALVNLKSSFLISDKVFPPLGILYIADTLRKEGYEPIWYDFAGQTKYKSVVEDVVFITITSPQISAAISYVKKFCIGKKVVIGGCGVSSLTKEQKTLFDVIVYGEAENCISEIFLGCSVDKLLSPNIRVYSVYGKKVNLDTVEFPARDLIKGYEYKINGRNATTMMTSRGCPHNCIFCVSGNIKGVRMISADKVCNEIDEIYKLGYRAVMIFDDIFTMKKERLKKIVNYMFKKGILYRCFTHINSVNRELCTILANSGCVEVGIGIETGSNDILKIINKGFTREKSISAIRMLNDFSIRTKAFLMLGLPGESYLTIAETKSWLEKAKPVNFDISIFSPFPNTEIWDNRYNYNVNWNGDISSFYKGKIGEYKSFISTFHLTGEDLVRERDLIEKTYKR